MQHRWRGLALLLVFVAPSLAGRHGVPSLELSAQQCAVQVSSVTPAGGTIVRDTMSVKATVASDCQLQSVTATVPNLVIPLTFNALGQWVRYCRSMASAADRLC